MSFQFYGHFPHSCKWLLKLQQSHSQPKKEEEEEECKRSNDSHVLHFIRTAKPFLELPPFHKLMTVSHGPEWDQLATPGARKNGVMGKN